MATSLEKLGVDASKLRGMSPEEMMELALELRRQSRMKGKIKVDPDSKEVVNAAESIRKFAESKKVETRDVMNSIASVLGLVVIIRKERDPDKKPAGRPKKNK